MTGPKRVNWYTVYDARTDEIVACGTTEMIVHQMGYADRNSFFSAITHAKARTDSKYIYHIEKNLPHRAGEVKRKVQKWILPM